MELKKSHYNVGERKEIIKKLFPKRNEDTIRKNFESIDDLTDAEFNALPVKSNKGGDVVKYYTDFERYNTTGNKKLSFFDVWFNRNQMAKKPYIKSFLDYLKKQRPGETELQHWNAIASMYFGKPQIFRPLLAMKYYRMFKPKSILDFTMGWGGRMIGACAMDVPHYIGIDLNTNLKEPYEKMVEFVKPYTNTKITLMFKDALKVDYSKLTYDMVLTSPPYYNIELYNKTTAKTQDDWDKEFYEPIIQKTWAGLQKGGHYCLNVNTEIYERVAKKILGKPFKTVKLEKALRTHSEATEKYSEFVYIWRK
jgi:hypothetical protein